MASETTFEAYTMFRRLGTSSEIRITVAWGLGTALQWFDFVAYAMFAPTSTSRFRNSTTAPVFYPD
jgi:hypothetical protein